MKSYPFTSQVTYDEEGLPKYDRAVNSDFLRRVFSNYFSDGIFYQPTNALQVVSDTGMQVAVEPGVCHIRGAMGIEENRRTLVVQAAEELDRIDTVVARLDLSVAVRSIDLYVVKGTAAESPQAPVLTRDSTTWELGLANLFIAKNTQTISQQRITDTRLDPDRCGLVAAPMGSLDTAPYFSQLTAAIAAHQEDAQAQIKALQDAIAAVEGDTAWMMQDLYDPQGRQQDIFEYADKTCAPVIHTSEEQTYGAATAELFGHVKLSDAAGTSDAEAGVAATPKCVKDSMAATKIGVSFYNGATDYGTYLYQIGNMIVGVIELYAPKTISAGGWVTYMHVDVEPAYRCNGRSPFGAGGDARDFFIGTDGNLQIYVNTTDAGKTFNVPIAYVKK